MESRNDKQAPKSAPVRKSQLKPDPKPKLRLVKLEPRIAPKIATNHNETLVRQPAEVKPKTKLQIVKLEGRIAPRLSANHNQTLVREPAKAAEVRKSEPKSKLRIVKLEGRIAPGLNVPNHNETLVRDRAANATPNLLTKPSARRSESSSPRSGSHCSRTASAQTSG